MFLNATSINNLLDDFAIVMPDFLAREDDIIFDLDLRRHFMTDLQLYGVKIMEIDIGERKFSVEPGNLYPSVVV
jgi:hypothetical protein